MRILIVEDDPFQAEQMATALRLDEDHIKVVSNLDDAKQTLASKESWPDLVILDAMFPEKAVAGRYRPPFMAGQFLDALDKCCWENGLERPDVVLISGQNEAVKSFDSVVSWLQEGRIRDVLPKSTAEVGWEFFQAVLRNRVIGLHSERELRQAAAPITDAFNSLKIYRIITKNSDMANTLWKKISVAARTGCNVFIHGERGTGKELVAQAIAKIRGRGVVSLNCSAIQPTLFESELFGTALGAFTEAKARPGSIDTAANGILFLDEIGSLAPENQAKLLRVVDDHIREYKRLGEDTTRKATCMFVFADLDHPLDAVEKNTMRPDLADRLLKGLSIELPPLRERRSDIPLLVDEFLNQFNREYQKKLMFTEELYAVFEKGPWPGNVRALAGIIQNAVLSIVSADPISWKDLYDAFAKREQESLRTQVGVSSSSVTITEPASSIPENVDDLLTQLTIEIKYDKPSLWLAFKPDSDKQANKKAEKMIIQGLELRLNDIGKEIFQEFKESLEARPDSDPEPLHCYKALLFLVLCPENKANLEDLRRILGLSAWDQRRKVGNELVTFQSITEPGNMVCERQETRNKKMYYFEKELLKSDS